MTPNRKLEHIKICLSEDVESSYTGFEDVMLLHSALPEADYSAIDTSIDFFGKKLSFPFLIASMTGGHPKAKEINASLAKAVEKMGIGMGVGSQRVALEDKSLEDTFSVVREFAPEAFIYANIGLPQLLKHGIEILDKIVEMIDADAVAIHLNFLQEAFQIEGDKDARNGISVIEEACKTSKVPVIVKETGAGIGREIASLLKEIKVSAIDVGGKGGTSFSAVEAHRLEDKVLKSIAFDFFDWGIPTAFCVVDCYEILPTIATGGIRTGIDVAKAIALGAVAASAALPFLSQAVSSSELVEARIKRFMYGFRIAMFLMGCKRVDEIARKPIFVSGMLAEWLRFRGFDMKKFCEARK